MPIKWEFEWYTTDGSNFITIDDWIKTLTSEEQEEYREANARHKSYRADAINSGNFDLVDGSYVWKDGEAEQHAKPNDPIWLEYWDRWQRETNSTCRLIRTEI